VAEAIGYSASKLVRNARVRALESESLSARGWEKAATFALAGFRPPWLALPGK
jgi:hypothetical protein